MRQPPTPSPLRQRRVLVGPQDRVAIELGRRGAGMVRQDAQAGADRELGQGARAPRAQGDDPVLLIGGDHDEVGLARRCGTLNRRGDERVNRDEQRVDVGVLDQRGAHGGGELVDVRGGEVDGRERAGRADLLVGGDAGVAGVGKPLDIIIRGRPVRAEQVKLPFYRRSKS